MVKATVGGEAQQPTNTNRRGGEDGNFSEGVEGPEIDQDNVDDVAPVSQRRSELGKVLIQSRSRFRRRHRQEQPADEGSASNCNQRIAGTNQPR